MKTMSMMEAAMPAAEKKKKSGRKLLNLQINEKDNGFTVSASRSAKGEYMTGEELVFESAGDALEYVASELGAGDDDDDEDDG